MRLLRQRRRTGKARTASSGRARRAGASRSNRSRIWAAVSVAVRLDYVALRLSFGVVDPGEDDEVPGVQAREARGVEDADLVHPEPRGLRPLRDPPRAARGGRGPG